MALLPFCRTPSGAVKIKGAHLGLYCFLLSLIIYFLHGRKAAVSGKSPYPIFQAAGANRQRIKVAVPQAPVETPWGVPIVWGDGHASVQHRARFTGQDIRVGLLSLVVGPYGRFVRRFLSSAETYFLPARTVTYYILTDNPRSLAPPVALGPERQLEVIPVAELPGWSRLARRRMALLADAIGRSVGGDVEYVFCADVDQEFVAPVGEEILGDLVATLHPELYGAPRKAFPYEAEAASAARVGEDEGDFYYSSELYGGLASEVLQLARACSLLILQDEAGRVEARGREESYLNRYLVDHRPTRVLSPEYGWWDSPLTADVPVHRIASLGRQCEAYDKQQREQHRC